MNVFVKLGRLVALFGSIFTFVQIILLASDQQGICFDEGCRAVDSLTTVSPLFINIGGFVFFQLIFWGIWLARYYQKILQYIRIVLLAGLAAEGVLVSFQHVIAQTFCSYCLIIFGCVILLNVLAGMWQIFQGGAVFLAVVLAFFILRFEKSTGTFLQELDSGSFAYVAGDTEEKRYLFFSSTCKYCEEIIESLDGDNDCAIRFNPIDAITEFRHTTAKRQMSYDPKVNANVLQSLGLIKIPVLLTLTESSLQAITGVGPIERYLSENCRDSNLVESSQLSSGYTVAPRFEFLQQDDGACSVDTDCEEPHNNSSGNFD